MYFIRSFDDKLKRRVYFYAVVEAPRHDEMMLSLNDGNIPDFAVIVEKGYDDPTPEVKAKMKEVLRLRSRPVTQMTSRQSRGEGLASHAWSSVERRSGVALAYVRKPWRPPSVGEQSFDLVVTR